MSLTNYEDQPSVHEEADATVTEDSNATTYESTQSYETPSAQHISTSSIADLDVSNLTISPSQATPKAQKQDSTTFAEYPSPYETLRQEVHNTTTDATTLSKSDAPETPARPSNSASQTAGIAMTPQSSPFLPPQPQPTSIPRPSTGRKKTDPLLHRVLDRTYRVQATPLTSNRYTLPPSRAAATPATTSRTQKRLFDSALSSSPEVAPPQLHAEIFSSPQRNTRTPGVSVLTPARTKSQKQDFSKPSRSPGIWDSDEEDFDDEVPFGHSPPRTMQFHVPQSRLMQTPGRRKNVKSIAVPIQRS